MKLIHLSDLHVSSTNDAEYTHLCRLVDHIVEHHPDAVVAITGDFVNDATREEFEVVARPLQRLVEHCRLLLTMPGNHDHKRWGTLPSTGGSERFLEFREDLTRAPGHFPYVMEVDEVQLICLDTCSAAGAAADLARGEVGYLQRMALAGYLELGEPRTRVVLMHHHPFYRDMGLELADADELMALLAARCDLLLFGHRHRADIWRDQHGIGWIAASSKSTEPGKDGLSYRVFLLADGVVDCTTEILT